MSHDDLFQVLNLVPLPGWLLLTLAPEWRWTQRIVHTAIIPFLLAPVYTVLAVRNFGGDSDFLSLQGLMTLFQNPEAVIAGWIHYLAFDLFIGAWEARDARRMRIPHAALVPCLLLTLMLGPVGLFAYLALRIAMRRRLVIDETETIPAPARLSETPVILRGRTCTLRRWNRNDAPALEVFANNPKIWRNLDDRFPHPYTARDAAEWIRLCEGEDDPPRILAIDHAGKAIGGIGMVLREDVYRKTAEIGYWIAEPFWGKGIATEAVGLFSDYALSRFDLLRLQATVFEWNPASARVLEKCGFRNEGLLASAAFKDGQAVDVFMYAKIKPRGG